MTVKTNLSNVAQHVSARKSFDCNGSLTGSTARLSSGRLPQEWRGMFETAQDSGDFYAVYSYATPIAWYAEGLWTVPDVRYSVTTSKHQTKIGLQRHSLIY